MATRLTGAGLAVLALLLAQTPGSATGRPDAGQIVEIEGKVFVRSWTHPHGNEPGWTAAIVGMLVYTGDSVKTGRDGSATIEFANRSRTTIQPGSLWIVDDPVSVSDDGGQWKQLTEDLGLMLFSDELGVTRGRLYVLIDGEWTPVALESPEEFLPKVLSIRR